MRTLSDAAACLPSCHTVGSLAENNRLRMSTDVIDAFETLMTAHRGEVNCMITSAEVCCKQRCPDHHWPTSPSCEAAHPHRPADIAIKSIKAAVAAAVKAAVAATATGVMLRSWPLSAAFFCPITARAAVDTLPPPAASTSVTSPSTLPPPRSLQSRSKGLWPRASR